MQFGDGGADYVIKNNFNWNTRQQWGDWLALLAGISMPLAFAPWQWFVVALIAPAGLFWLWQDISPRRAFWRGYLFGIGMFGVGVSWVYISLHDFANIPWWGASLLTLVFIASLALFPAVLGGLLTRYAPDNKASKWFLITPALWVIMEWLRSWFLTGFPWLFLGYSYIDTWLNGFAPIIGVYGLSWISVFLSASLIWMLHKRRFIGFGLMIFLLVAGMGAYLQSIIWTQPKEKTWQVALVQGNLPEEFRWQEGQKATSVHRYWQMSLDYAGVDLIVWPETAVPLVRMDAEGLFFSLKRFYQQYQTSFLIGIPVYKDKKFFNAVVSVGDEPEAHYYKHHLVPFGEFIPFRWLLPSLLDFVPVPMSEFSPGAKQQANIKLKEEWIGVSICYEAAFPRQMRPALPQATLLVNVSNDSWFSRSIAPHQHLTIARMRALELGRYLLRATNTGISAIINPQGQLVKQSQQFEVSVLRGEAIPHQGRTPYISIGHWLVGLGVFLSFISGFALYQRGELT